MTGYQKALLTTLKAGEWQSTEDEEEYKSLMKDDWLRRKLNRERRLREHVVYLERVAPDLPDVESGVVVDLGPGAGELLEIARELGHEAVGVDAWDGVGGMGAGYLRASCILARRANVDIIYDDALTIIGRMLRGGFLHLQDTLISIGDAVLINARGSIEQIFSNDMDGRPHSEHRDASRMTWRLNDKILRHHVERLFRWAHVKLRPGGRFAIHFNGSVNHDEAVKLFQSIALQAGFVIEQCCADKLVVWSKQGAFERQEGVHVKEADCPSP